MPKAEITFEDVGGQSVTILLDVSEIEGPVTPAVAMAMATRAMFRNGMLAEAATIGMQAIEMGHVPEECILHHFNLMKQREREDEG